jgi:DNA gyrase subunit B
MGSIKYDENSITTVEKLEHVRLRPTGYVTDVEVMGQWHILKELIDNSIDELEMMGTAGKLTLCMCRSPKGRYQMIVQDNGRGVPIGKLLKVFTVLHTSGKFDTDSYLTSSGLFGVGSKATAGLSKHFRALTFRPDGVGDLYVQDGIAPDDIRIWKKNNTSSGTTIIYEPDPTIFKRIGEFSESGYNQIISLLEKFNLFSSYQIEFYIYNQILDDSFWELPTKDTINVICNILNKGKLIYNNIDKSNPDEYLKEYFNVLRPWAWQHRVTRSIMEDRKLGFDILIYGVKYEQIGGHLALINSVPIDDPKSSHITAFHNTIKRNLVKYIGDKDISKYFLQTYKLPIFFAMNIKYSGAELTGTTKHSFSSSEFSLLFGKVFSELLDSSTDKMSQLYELLKEDINSKYVQFTTGTTKVESNSKRLMLSLNHPTKFNDCSTSDRSKAELFLTEGDSANSNEGRNSEFQASYSLRGKPFNAITDKEHVQTSMLNVRKNAIFEDIITILGLSPNQTDFSNLRYGKVFIMADADSHGKHICNIVIGNLYAYNPKFIESGILHIVTPPFYGLRMKNKSVPNIYIYNPDDFVNILAQNVYYRALELKIYSPGVFEGKVLNEEEFVQFARIVSYVGDMINRLSKEHLIHPLLLEQLTYVTYYLTPETMDLEYIKTIFNNPNITYDEVNNILSISIGREDFIISLTNIANSLYKEILPFLRKIEWDKLAYVITTKHTDTYKNVPISIMQLYQIFETLNDLFYIERYKGLGSMLVPDKARTCIDPKHRTSFQITTVGDEDKLFNYLGSDSKYRKSLLEMTDVNQY